jgi:hypothetical protein
MVNELDGLREKVRSAVENYCAHSWPDNKPLPDFCPECNKIVEAVLAECPSESHNTVPPPVPFQVQLLELRRVANTQTEHGKKR